MKLSKKVWVIVGIGILVIVLVSLYVFYFQQVGEREQLSGRLAAAQEEEGKLDDERDELEKQLAQAESSLDANLAQFPESVESIEYGEDLFELADDCNLALTSLHQSKPTNKTVGTVTYSASSLTIVVSGGIDDILEFIEAIITGEDFQLPWSADLEGVIINIAGGTASITLDIYGYKGK